MLNKLIDHTSSEKIFRYRDTTDVELPEEISNWFKKLITLEGVPLAYLLPHPQLLPPESFRFFQVDSNWIKALAAGAFAIGQHHYRTEAEAKYKDFESTTIHPITGVFIRSALVTHYRSLILKGYEEDIAADIPAESLPVPSMRVLRSVKLGPDIHLVLFDGLVKSVALFTPPQSLELRVTEAAWVNDQGILQLDKIGDEDSSQFVKRLMTAGDYILFKRKTGK